MNYYQEITLIDQGDVNLYHVHSAVYESVHTALCEHRNGFKVNIGISFPLYQYTEKKDKGQLGKKVRLFAKTKEELELLNLSVALDGYADYIHIASVKEVGEKATHYEVYSRYRHKGHQKKAERLQAHLIKKHGVEWFDEQFGSYEAVLAHCVKTSTVLSLPFVTLKSNANGHYYDLRLKRQKLDAPTKAFSFDGFGLTSKEKLSAVPAW